VAAYQKKNNYSGERRETNQEVLAQLKERKVNGDQLDHAEEDKFEALEAAQARENK
jgi:hypothetical protein